MNYAIVLNKSLISEDMISNFNVKATKRFAGTDWHVHLVLITDKNKELFISKLQEHMIDGPWYNHIVPQTRDHNNNNLYVIFKYKRFEVDDSSILQMHEIQHYCEQLEIPEDQIDFTPRTPKEIKEFFSLPDLN